MDSNSTLGFTARILFGIAGAAIGFYVASLGFARTGSSLVEVSVMPGIAGLLTISGFAFAVASILWVVAPRRASDSPGRGDA